jgi:hypothetical protein
MKRFGMYIKWWRCKKGSASRSQRCRSGIFIPVPDLCPMSIPDPGSKNGNKREWWKKLVVPFFCSHKYHKIKNYFIFKQAKKKIWANLQRILELITHKFVIKLSKIWIWDPR